MCSFILWVDVRGVPARSIMNKARIDVLRKAFHEQALPSSWVPRVHMPCLMDKTCSKITLPIR